jgi:hypothetical protein
MVIQYIGEFMHVIINHRSFLGFTYNTIQLSGVFRSCMLENTVN